MIPAKHMWEITLQTDIQIKCGNIVWPSTPENQLTNAILLTKT